MSGGIFLDMVIHDFDMAQLRGAEPGRRGVRPRRGARRPADRRGRRRRHRRHGADPRGRHADHHRQQPRGGLRVRPAGRGVRQRRHGGLRQPGPARRAGTSAARPGPASRCRGSSSTATSSPTARSGRRSTPTWSRAAPSPVGTADARHCTAVALAAGLSLREGRPVQVKEIGCDHDRGHRCHRLRRRHRRGRARGQGPRRGLPGPPRPGRRTSRGRPGSSTCRTPSRWPAASTAATPSRTWRSSTTSTACTPTGGRPRTATSG